MGSPGDCSTVSYPYGTLFYHCPSSACVSECASGNGSCGLGTGLRGCRVCRKSLYVSDCNQLDWSRCTVYCRACFLAGCDAVCFSSVFLLSKKVLVNNFTKEYDVFIENMWIRQNNNKSHTCLVWDL